MSDCHSSLGAARSKRRSGCARAGVGSRCSQSSPSSCSTRRTAVSEIPSDAKRFSTSRIRRVPYSGWARRSAKAASCRASLTRRLRCAANPVGRGRSPSSPATRHRVSQLCSVLSEIPNTRAASPRLTPPCSISRITRRRNSTG